MGNDQNIGKVKYLGNGQVGLSTSSHRPVTLLSYSGPPQSLNLYALVIADMHDRIIGVLSPPDRWRLLTARVGGSRAPWQMKRLCHVSWGLLAFAVLGAGIVCPVIVVVFLEVLPAAKYRAEVVDVWTTNLEAFAVHRACIVVFRSGPRNFPLDSAGRPAHSLCFLPRPFAYMTSKTRNR